MIISWGKEKIQREMREKRCMWYFLESNILVIDVLERENK